MIDRMEVVRAARRYLGIYFKKGGRDRSGVDCVGLLISVGRELEIPLKDTIEYTFDPNPRMMQEFVFDQSIRRKVQPLQNGYIAILKQAGFPMHTGIITIDGDRPTIINANMKARRVIEQPLDQWLNDLIEVRDYKGVE